MRIDWNDGMPGTGSAEVSRWRPEGGSFGLGVGIVALIVAWGVSMTLDLGSRPPGIGFDPGGMASAVIVFLVIAIVVTASLIRSGSGARVPWWVGVGFSAVLAARMLTHEISLRITDPQAGGGDPLVRVSGRVVDSLRLAPTSSIGDPEQPSWRVDLRVEKASHPGLEGRILVVGLDIEDARWRPGAHVTVHGRLSLVPSPLNPGERDRRRGRRDRVPAMLVVPSPALATVTAVDAWPRWFDWWTVGRERWSRAVEVVGAAVTSRHPETRGLIEAVLLGDRQGLDDSIRADAEDAGVAPMLAISGWHLAIIGAFTAMVVGRHRPIGRCLSFTGVIAFATVVLPGAGVRRATMMVVLAGLALAAGRRGRGASIVLLAGTVLVWLDPTIVELVGFRLSLLATLALVVGSGPARRRWFGDADRVGRRPTAALRDRWTMTATASMVAWITTLPIVLATFGRVSLVGVPGTVLVAPIFMASVILATVTVVATVLLGECPSMLAELTSVPTAMFIAMIRGIAKVAPIWRESMPPWSGWVAMVPSISAVLALRYGEHHALRRRILWTMAGVTSAALLFAGTRPVIEIPHDRVRIDAIAVGDGTAMLVRGGGAAVLHDAGSSSVVDVGRRVIGPALRALGVRRLDAIVVTHANADHFNAVFALTRAIPVDRVVVTPHFLGRARADPDTPTGELVQRLHDAGIDLVDVARGDRLCFGDLVWTILHPVRGESCRTINDESMVATVGLSDDASSRSRLLLCGDVQDEAMARVRAREPGLRASVMELPHHGSWRPIAAVLMGKVDPIAVIQSTGPARWRLDRWRMTCAGRPRGITCRDGLVSFEIDAAGCVHTLDSAAYRCHSNGDVGRSEEAKARLVPTSRSSTVGPGPDHHDRAIKPLSFRQNRDENPGHSLQQRRARSDPDPGITQVERSISDGLTRLKVPGHHDIGLHGVPIGLAAVDRRGFALPHRRVVQHDPVTSTTRSRRFRRVVENSPGAGGLCRGGRLGRGPPRAPPGSGSAGSAPITGAEPLSQPMTRKIHG
jgi:competence protein ComEC